MERLPRFVVIFIVVAGVISGSVALAADKSPTDKSGKGCGDKNHVHTGPPGSASP